MRVSLATHGGIAAGINLRRPPAVVYSARLVPPAVEELSRLVAAVRAEPTPAGGERARDAMTYVITVDDGRSPASFTVSDATMTPAFAALIGWLRDHT